ncbi:MULTISPECIES: phosphatase PAP2 family protein [unclassified Thioalkalivibrio]|uniref:phosphatase PAP2 family protein n=1 Tax=unclassified Thioalkalivibrio TaxID=2621013 RepID=UPI000365D8B7|nr:MULTISPECIES: phosphatase PAP2 family protein [unclassified Thioalkalivibrio]
MRVLQWMDELELAVCRQFNHYNRRRVVSGFFGGVSRLGDGVAWYALMLVLPLLHGPQAAWVSLQMAVVGLASLPVYKWLKRRTSRRRPCHRDRPFTRTVDPLDEFSFPSGHTMHAVGFTVVLVAWFPVWAWLVVPFAALVAASRLVLALHYPSDVAMGALIGASMAGAVLWLAGLF